jgi:aspartyl-tRNA synthetase
MKRTLISGIRAGDSVKIQGFVEAIRIKRAISFAVIRDMTGRVQLTVLHDADPESAQVLKSLTPQSVVTVEGVAAANDAVKLGGIELIPAFVVVDSAADPLPLQSGAHIDTRLDYRWLDLREDKNLLIFRLQTELVGAMRAYLLERRFLEIHTPKLIGTASESGSEVFELDYFGRKAYLSQSPQFYKQMAMAGGLERIFETGPVFRAEKSYTNKHATEFTGFDVEISYIDSYFDVMRLEEELLTAALIRVKSLYGENIRHLFGMDIVIPQTPFPVISLSALYTELAARYGYQVNEEDKDDLTTEAEQLCKRLSLDKYGHEFLFVVGYGAEKRAFYHMRGADGVPLGYDLIWRGVEITTGAQREHRYSQLKAQAEEKGLGEDVRFYLDFFKYGCPPHGGFGLGIDRLTMLLLGISIKEAMFLFRGPNRLTP